ncbi:uncharacterized protein K452DRAFT_248721 [Aplosporella prunicola CBS 121167]|uniref:Enoyl reductase (ER) domain-containing protein n=1 Tax=Aplosporella prunicola CBS 121167 TaxID=1176127 RepID=A0A6A6BKC1_9PEZI|nr:uncharacterized protein K452DRAFT_248721 [Aplosporella prunicola CBS 121167]KAF2143011.1 hypothetical protein K452DRAFT_248721 [Aplosporella prunicola CBS 121167]
MAPAMMDAVVFKGVREVAVERRPVPAVLKPTDIVVKVKYSGLCGSELHVYRGLEASGGTDFITGHEFTGTVTEIGSDIKTVSVGDAVVCPFTISCGNCFYCKLDLSSRCIESSCFGYPGLDGGQAEYVRIPFADSSVFKSPEGIKEQNLVLMADIFPTGYFAAHNGFTRLPPQQTHAAVAVVIGCGPVGICALVAALQYKPQRIFAVDSVPARLEQAAALGATPINFTSEDVKAVVSAATDGRGADVVLEIVGLSRALETAFSIVRPFGVVSSVGVHNGEMPLSAMEGYDKNIQLQMGRCPVRSVFPQALAVLKENQENLECLTKNIMPLSQAPEAFKKFDNMEVQKIVFEVGK